MTEFSDTARAMLQGLLAGGHANINASGTVLNSEALVTAALTLAGTLERGVAAQEERPIRGRPDITLPDNPGRGTAPSSPPGA